MLWVHPAIDIGTQSSNPTGQHHLPLECLCQIHPAKPGKQPWNVSRRAKVDTDPKWRMSMWHLQFHSFECVKRWSRIVPILPHLQGQSNQSGPCRWSNPLASSTLISPKDWHQWSLEHDRSQPLPSQFQCLRIWDPLPYKYQSYQSCQSCCMKLFIMFHYMNAQLLLDTKPLWAVEAASTKGCRPFTMCKRFGSSLSLGFTSVERTSKKFTALCCLSLMSLW